MQRATVDDLVLTPSSSSNREFVVLARLLSVDVLIVAIDLLTVSSDSCVGGASREESSWTWWPELELVTVRL